MKYYQKDISIKRIIIIIFIVSMLTSIFGIGCIVFGRWYSSAELTIKSIAGNIGEIIYNRVYSLLEVPHQMNVANHRIIENGILNLSDGKLRDKFFVTVLGSHSDEIYSFSFGTAEGEYYGARRNELGLIEIMRNDATTGGSTWYYSVNEDFTAGDIVLKAGTFDPRTRHWYKAAEAAGGPVISPVYKHFVMDDLTVSVALPVYDSNGKLQGVLGTHMLLSGIETFLEDTVEKYQGHAVIVEKNTGALIANSMGVDNFTVLSDGTLKRYKISDIQLSDIRQAYDYYKLNLDPNFIYKGTSEKLCVNTREIRMNGIDWLVITAVPEELLMDSVTSSIRWTVFLVVLALLLSMVSYNGVIEMLTMPINNLLEVSDALTSGDLSKRVEVVRNDEIGNISIRLNKLADKMQSLVENLEANVRERTEELHTANAVLEENKNQLRLILDTAAEAIYGIDLAGNCTFCNLKCIELLGYSDEEELLGKNMHSLIHHSSADGTPLSAEDCRVLHSIKENKVTHADNEVFWKADGTTFNVEYNAVPQVRNGVVVGGVITFMDITDRKQKEEMIRYLSYHDPLTGLFNRTFLKDNLSKIDSEDNLPLSVIFADINGLKMTNDVFGHTAGDKLIKQSADILRWASRENDIVARIGGDEFVILLPRTNQESAENIMSRIRVGFSNARVEAIKCSISLGYGTKINADQSLEEIMANAENAMYKDKVMNRQSINKDMIDTIVDTLHSRSPREKRHSIGVMELCGKIGSALKLSEPEISKLKRAGYLHDIGKIVLNERILTEENLTEEEIETMRQHSALGYRIFSLFDDKLDLAEYVYSHHERWDGEGYPRGLKGEQIPLISRIISVAETYERVLNRGEETIEERKRTAVETIRSGAGTQFDPEIAALFVEMMEDSSSI